METNSLRNIIKRTPQITAIWSFIIFTFKNQSHQRPGESWGDWIMERIRRWDLPGWNAGVWAGSVLRELGIPEQLRDVPSCANSSQLAVITWRAAWASLVGESTTTQSGVGPTQGRAGASMWQPDTPLTPSCVTGKILEAGRRNDGDQASDPQETNPFLKARGRQTGPWVHTYFMSGPWA